MKKTVLLLIASLALLAFPVSALNEGGPLPSCNPAVPAPGQPVICKSHHNWGTHLYRNGSRLADFTTDFQIAGPSHVQLNGLVNLVHRNLAFYPNNHSRFPGWSGPVGWSILLGYRYAATCAALGARPTGAEPGMAAAYVVHWIPGAVSSGNITNYDEHYKDAHLSGYLYAATPGCYRIEVWGYSHSDLAPGVDGLVGVNRDADGPRTGTYGFLVTKISPAN